jgi:hypothetical protein
MFASWFLNYMVFRFNIQSFIRKDGTNLFDLKLSVPFLSKMTGKFTVAIVYFSVFLIDKNFFQDRIHLLP